MPGAQENNPATNAQANAAARAALFQSGFMSSIELPSQVWSDGGSFSFDLPHAGIGLYAVLRLTGNLTWTDTATNPIAPVLSNLAPFNLFQSIVFKDYLGNTRINAGGTSLHRRETLQYYTDTSGEAPNTVASRAYSNSAIDNFKVGPTSATAQAVDFAVLVPFSFHENTTIGTLPFTVPSGNNTIYLTLNTLLNASATVNAESPLQQGGSHTATTTANLTNAALQVTYYYIDPLPGQALPLMDFSQVYEIVDVKTTDNLSASATKQVILPTGRTYQGLYAQIVNAGALYDTGVSSLKFLINESTPTMQENYNSYLHRTRRTYGRDLPQGELVWDLRARPISPSNYGSIALQILFGSTFAPSGETYFNLCKESLYVLQTQVY